MTPETVLSIGQRALEMTLSFIPKLLGAATMLVFAGPWMLKELVGYTRMLIESIPSLVG